MANVLTFLQNRILPHECIKRFTCLLSGNYVQGNAIGVAGETLSFNTALNPNKAARAKLPNGSPSGQLVPNTKAEVSSVPNGYTAQVEQNAVSPTANNYVLRIFAAGSGNAAPVELAAGAYPAALTGAPIVIEMGVPAKYN